MKAVNPFEDAPLDTRQSQAARVVAKFGNARKLAAALSRISARDPSRVYRWTYPTGKRGGTGGIIPSSAMSDVLRAAHLEGVVLTPEDLDPRAR